MGSFLLPATARQQGCKRVNDPLTKEHKRKGKEKGTEENRPNPALLPWILARALLAVSAAPQMSTDWEETPKRFQVFVQHLQWQLSKVSTS